MSLKAFHVVFILASIILSAYFSFWALGDYRASEAVSSLVMGIGGLISTVTLCIYLVWVTRKELKNYSYLVLALALVGYSQAAWACPTCLANSSSPMVKAANVGVVFLLGVVSSVLVGFAGLFTYWARRSTT